MAYNISDYDDDIQKFTRDFILDMDLKSIIENDLGQQLTDNNYNISFLIIAKIVHQNKLEHGDLCIYTDQIDDIIKKIISYNIVEDLKSKGLVSTYMEDDWDLNETIVYLTDKGKKYKDGLKNI